MHLGDVVARLGVPRERLFEGRDEAELTDPAARLSIAEIEALVARAIELTGEPGLGFHLGLQMRVSAHGYLGFAAMAAPDLRAAAALAARFAPTRTRAIAIHVHEEAGTACLVVDELVALGAARETLVFALLVGIQRIASALTGRELDGRAEVAFDRPAYFARFEGVVQGRVSFGAPTNRLVFDAAHLDLPIALADPAALRLARQGCERELEALGVGSEARSRGLRALLELDGGGFRGLEEVADLVHVSSRTLKRRLSEAGAPFSRLVDDERKGRALLLLASQEPSIEAIAERLGYSDVANFARAFRRWTGQSPGCISKARSAPRPLISRRCRGRASCSRDAAEVRSIEAGAPRGLAHVAGRARERARHVGAIERVDGGLLRVSVRQVEEVAAEARAADRARLLRLRPREREVVRVEDVAARDRDGVLDRRGELAHVAGPRLLAQRPHRLDADAAHVAAQPAPPPPSRSARRGSGGRRTCAARASARG